MPRIVTEYFIETTVERTQRIKSSLIQQILMSAYIMPGSVLDAENRVVNEKYLLPWSFYLD